jgi:hypothetical protein
MNVVNFVAIATAKHNDCPFLRKGMGEVNSALLLKKVVDLATITFPRIINAFPYLLIPA